MRQFLHYLALLQGIILLPRRKLLEVDLLQGVGLILLYNLKDDARRPLADLPYVGEIPLFRFVRVLGGS